MVMHFILSRNYNVETWVPLAILLCNLDTDSTSKIRTRVTSKDFRVSLKRIWEDFQKSNLIDFNQTAALSFLSESWLALVTVNRFTLRVVTVPTPRRRRGRGSWVSPSITRTRGSPSSWRRSSSGESGRWCIRLKCSRPPLITSQWSQCRTIMISSVEIHI